MHAHKFGFQSTGDINKGILNAIRSTKVNDINTDNPQVLHELHFVENTKRRTSIRLLQ